MRAKRKCYKPKSAGAKSPNSALKTCSLKCSRPPKFFRKVKAVSRKTNGFSRGALTAQQVMVTRGQSLKRAHEHRR